jgi:hypothetical protein
MRRKRKYTVITFPTTADAMAMENFCRKRDIPGRHIPVPGEISAGCGLAWRMLPEEFPQLEGFIHKEEGKTESGCLICDEETTIRVGQVVMLELWGR